MASVFHGGRLDAAAEKYGGDVSKWLDLSTGINPNPYSIPDISADAWTRLPDRDAQSALIATAADVYEAPERASCALGNGSEAIIHVLPTLFKPQSVALVGFTYQEHGVAWQQAGHSVLVADGLESAEASARIVVVVNPNNPDGAMQDPDSLVALASRLGAKGGALIVDEAFADVAPQVSVMPNANEQGLIVLRSFGKFYGLAGARVGFAFGNEMLIKNLQDRMGPWPLSGASIEVAQRALSNAKWREKTQSQLAEQRAQMETQLIDAGMEIVGGTDLFVLAEHRKADELHAHLARNQILTRPFPGRADWLRFGMLPKGKRAQTRFAKALSSFRA